MNEHDAKLNFTLLPIGNHLLPLDNCESEKSTIGETVDNSDDRYLSNSDIIRKVSFSHTIDDVVREIRYRINRKTKLTASAGIGPNRMLAKIYSDWNKPNGQFKVEFSKEKIIQFMRQLPTRKVLMYTLLVVIDQLMKSKY